MRNGPLHEWLTIIVVSVTCIALAPPLAVDGKFSHLEFSLLLLVATLLLFVFSRNPGTGVRVPTLPIALLVLMGLSILWSVDRLVSARDVAAFVAIAIAALLLVQMAELNTLAIGVAASGVVLVAWCGISILATPGDAFTSTGALIGPYGNRNGLAYALLQSVPAALAMRLFGFWGTLLKVSSIAALSIGVVATTSKTSLFVLALVFVLAGILLVRKNRVAAWSLMGVAVIAGLVIAANFGRVLGYLGKDSTINGRTAIWEALLPLIGARPLTGYGWSLAWPVHGAPSTAVTAKSNGVVLYHAHNELLNWAVTTGIVGVLAMLSLYIFTIWGGARLLNREHVLGRSWVLLGAAVLLARGATDISETLPQGWFVLMMLVAATARYLSGTAIRDSSGWLVWNVFLPSTQSRAGTKKNEMIASW